MNHRYSCWTCSSVNVVDDARYLYHCAPPYAKFHLCWVTKSRASSSTRPSPCVLSSQQILQAQAYPEIKPFTSNMPLIPGCRLLCKVRCVTLCRLVHVLIGTFLINKACKHS